MEKDMFQQFENGTLANAGQQTDVAFLKWNKHKEFTGVSLKNVATTEHTAGLFTCHLVRIEPGCKIGTHSHPASIEVHEVIKGSGICLTSDGEIPYVPGTMSIIACNAAHEVRAGKEGLCLFAKFITIPV